MTVYAVVVRFEVFADTAGEAREIITGILDQAFGEPEVSAIECQKPRWVPVSGRDRNAYTSSPTSAITPGLLRGW